MNWLIANQILIKQSLISTDSESDELEKKADLQAYNWMVNKEYYNTVCCKKDYDISKENKYPKAFVVYLLAKDKHIKYSSKIYQDYNKMIK